MDLTDHDELLRKHREKFNLHREWMKQQQEALRDVSTVAAATSAPPPASTQEVGASPGGVSVSPHRFERSAVTFPPQQRVNAVSNRASYSRDGSFPCGMSPLNVHSRATQWARRKEQKLEEMRTTRVDQELSHCTFTPVVASEAKSTSCADFNGRTEAVGVVGLDNFLRRQENARLIRQEQSRRAGCDGSRWTGRKTVPKEFHLGHRSDRIPSLQQPLRAPFGLGSFDFHSGLAEVFPRKAGARESSPLSERAGNPVAAAGGGTAQMMPPRGTFSEKTSTAVIDVALLTNNRPTTESS